MTGTGPAWVDDEYAAIYREHNARLVGYARSLTGNQAVAEDLAAEAHFRVWRRIRAGHAIENPSAYLTTTVRNLAAGLGRARREVSRDAADLPEDPERAAIVAADPEQRASHVDLISRLLKELPERWAKALWYAEVEDLPMEAVGERIGASAGTTAVVLTRARERLRQAFLQSQPGMPANEECEQYWKQIPTIVRATASARRTKTVLEHCDGCEDCRTRMLALTEANTRLPLLLGPALFGIVLGGATWFLPAVAGVGAGAAAGTAATAGKAGATTRVGSRLARHGLSPTKATVYGGAAAAVGIAAVAAAIALGSTPPSHPTAAVQPQATTRSPAAAKQPASAPTSAASAVASAPSTTSPTLTTSAAHDAANLAQQTPAAGTNSATASSAAAASNTPAAPTSSTAAPPLVANSPSATASATPTLAATLAPTQSPSMPGSPPPSLPTQSPTTGPNPTSGPTAPPSCDIRIFGICVIW
jgi:RNA polymerase sigma factor (sigma-70 family)